MGSDDSGGPHDPDEPVDEQPRVEDGDDEPLARILPFPIPETPLETWSPDEGDVWTCGETFYGTDLGRPTTTPAPEVPDERVVVEGAGDAVLAHILRFEIPWDGVLYCGGGCVYGEPRRLAPVVPIGGRERPQE